MKKTKKAFTLAEVLITLAIIGVIAAISVPSLIQKTNQAELITAWKKDFATISQAMSKYNFDNGDFTGTLSGNQLRDNLKSNLKFIKTCESTDYVGNCWHSAGEWQSLSGKARSGTIDINAGAILSSGSLFIIQKAATMNCITPANYNQRTDACFLGMFDINGFKKPNTIGKDIYGVSIFGDGSVVPFNDASPTWACRDTPTATYSEYNGWNCSSENLYKKQ